MVEGQEGKAQVEPLPVNMDMTPLDFGIICAFQVERDALCRALGFRDTHRQSQAGLTFFAGMLELGGQRRLRVALAMAIKIGQLEAYHVTAQLIGHIRPAAILFAGIAGAVKKDVHLGDVVLGESTYYYPPGKLKDGTMLPAPEMLPANRWLLSRAQNLPTWNPRLPPKPGRRANTAATPKVHSGVIASGEMVVADEAFRAELAKVHTHMLAVETEGHAFYKAAWDQEPSVPALVIRSASDDAGKRKARGTLKDQWQQWAAASVAAFVVHFLRDCSQVPPAHASISSLIVPTASKIDRGELLSILVNILGPEFEGIVFRLEGEGLKRGILPPSSTAQQTRAIELMRWVESPGGCGLPALKTVIARECPLAFRPRIAP